MRAFVVEHHDGAVTAGVRDVDESTWLTEGDALVEVEWSCCNYKDAMVLQPGSRVARRSPLIAGVDAAGRVLEGAGGLERGDVVIAHGHGFGTSAHGGFAERLRCESAWLTRAPEGLDARTAMVFGTAGYTAMASVLALEDAGVVRGDGEVLVTGATGGVGAVAVALLASRGHRVVALSGKPEAAAWLTELGASAVIGRDELDDRPDRVLGPERFAGAIDVVGGETLARVLRVLRWGAPVAASGLVGGSELTTTVYPFITRNVALLGIDSVLAPPDVRARVWAAVAESQSDEMCSRLTTVVIGLDGLPRALEALHHGAGRGRVLVDVRR